MATAKKKTTKKKTQKQIGVTIPPPNMQCVQFNIVGTSPYVGNKFSSEALAEMRATQEAGSTAKKGKKRDPKDFGKSCKEALHVSTDGWEGIPAVSFRAAMISACRVAGFQMTRGKLAVFVDADGLSVEGVPLVRIRGKWEHYEAYVRNASGVADIRARPMWREWSCKVTVRFDADMFTASDVYNLIKRAGMQVGIGAGRPDSRTSVGQGWGTFDVAA
jgi:hypothetical protein